jgi:predicted nucleotidyltransferase
MHSQISDTHIILDETRLRQEIRARGYATTKQFADAIGIHRNTIGNYLGGNAGMPSALARILEALELTPADVLSLSRQRRQVPGLAIADLVDRLISVEQNLAVVLFGSRARGSAKPYSDYDLGIYRVDTLEFALFSRLLDVASAWNDESLSTIQLVDFTHAGEDLLHSAADDLVFLAGSYSAWCDLLHKAKVSPYE